MIKWIVRSLKGTEDYTDAEIYYESGKTRQEWLRLGAEKYLESQLEYHKDCECLK